MPWWVWRVARGQWGAGAAYWAADAEPTSLVMLCATREEYTFISCSNLGYRRYKIQFNYAPNNTPGHLREDSIALRLNYVLRCTLWSSQKRLARDLMTQQEAERSRKPRGQCMQQNRART